MNVQIKNISRVKNYVISIQLIWIPDLCNIKENEMIDRAEKKTISSPLVTKTQIITKNNI